MESVVVCITTYLRPVELGRLLNGLKTSSVRPRATVVVDNAREESVRELVESVSANNRYIASSVNSGPGAGWKRGMEEALEQFPNELTHFLVLDDDVVLASDVIERLLAAMRSTGAEAAAPLLTDADGKIWAPPEPVVRPLRKAIRAVRSPADAMARLGQAPLDFVWCTGACVLVSRRAVEEVGFHRTDFWMLGEDLEFSMRVAARFRAVFLPDVIVPHLPPKPNNLEAAKQSGYRKFLSLLTNLSYLSFHVAHSAHMRSYLAGNFKRFFLTEGISPRTLMDGCACFRNGALRGLPAGRTGVGGRSAASQDDGPCESVS